MEQNKRKDFIEALRLAAQSLEDSREPIDNLNGRLDELTYYGDITGTLEEKSQETINDAIQLYRELPVWDWLDDLRDKLREVADEVEKNTTEVTNDESETI